MLDGDHASQLTGRIDPRTNTDATRRSYTDQFVAIWEGRDSASTEVAGLTVSGRQFDGILHWSAPRGSHGLQLDEVVVAIDDVTELKAAQRELASANALLGAIADSQRQFISHAGADNVFGDLLTQVVELTGAGFAALGTFDPNWGVEAVSARGWDEADRSPVIGPGGRRIGADGLHEIAERLGPTDRAIAAGRFELQVARARGAEVPEALSALLSLPLAHGDEILGRIVLGNRPGAGFGHASRFVSKEPLIYQRFLRYMHVPPSSVALSHQKCMQSDNRVFALRV